MQASIKVSRYTIGLLGSKMREYAKTGELDDELYEWYKDLEDFFNSFGDLSDHSEDEAVKITLKEL